MRTLVWFRGKDLRLSDHRPLADALAHGDVVPVFVLDPYFFAPERARRLPHRMQFLLESIAALEASIEKLGSRLLVVPGKSARVVPELVRRLRVDRVVGQRWSEPVGRERDRRVEAALDVPFVLFEGETLHRPGTLRTGAGAPFSVFTPFSRAFFLHVTVDEPLDAPRELPPLPREAAALATDRVPSVDELGIQPNPRLLAGGETRALERLSHFLRGAARRYDVCRDRLDIQGTSRLSADLKFGTLSPRAVWHAVTRALEGEASAALDAFRNELVWREFTHSTLWDHPQVLEAPYRPEWAGFPWLDDDAAWNAWKCGKTGYPIVDAAARQLLAEGFVPNRARMIAASFLTKDLLVDYRRGEAHYLEWLTDGDFAQNNAGWQWSAGSGMDAQPYFRVFNPLTQSEKFDPNGDYIRRFVPELASLPAPHVHAPFRAPKAVLEAANVIVGKTYPAPIVDHSTARARFLAIARRHLSKRG
jgi:deoxyribodipyrimidine photo-lyase